MGLCSAGLSAAGHMGGWIQSGCCLRPLSQLQLADFLSLTPYQRQYLVAIKATYPNDRTVFLEPGSAAIAHWSLNRRCQSPGLDSKELQGGQAVRTIGIRSTSLGVHRRRRV